MMLQHWQTTQTSCPLVCSSSVLRPRFVVTMWKQCHFHQFKEEHASFGNQPALHQHRRKHWIRIERGEMGEIGYSGQHCLLRCLQVTFIGYGETLSESQSDV